MANELSVKRSADGRGRRMSAADVLAGHLPDKSRSVISEYIYSMTIHAPYCWCIAGSSTALISIWPYRSSGGGWRNGCGLKLSQYDTKQLVLPFINDTYDFEALRAVEREFSKITYALGNMSLEYKKECVKGELNPWLIECTDGND